jgi:hypothetical protein
MGLRLGMSANDAFRITGMSVDLSTYKVISGKRIVNDTIALADCGASFRRSIAFDSLQKLKVVGLTYRSDSSRIARVRDCTYDWLVGQYGSPVIDSTTEDTVDTYMWQAADAVITMDARPYNERHSFVLVYFYRREIVANKED